MPEETAEDALKLVRENGPWVYELFAVLIHSGSALGGHYYAHIKSLGDDGERDRWLCVMELFFLDTRAVGLDGYQNHNPEMTRLCWMIVSMLCPVPFSMAHGMSGSARFRVLPQTSACLLVLVVRAISISLPVVVVQQVRWCLVTGALVLSILSASQSNPWLFFFSFFGRGAFRAFCLSSPFQRGGSHSTSRVVPGDRCSFFIPFHCQPIYPVRFFILFFYVFCFSFRAIFFLPPSSGMVHVQR